ncbi:MAG: FAD:protein FMN transferase [Pseudomonadota bacterium]
MGTRWHVTYIADSDGLVRGEAQAGIEALLEEVNDSMSTYREDSEISRFNSGALTLPWQPSKDFWQVLKAALMVGELSGGAYDVTVGPLVRRWGFGPDAPAPGLPQPAELEQLMATVGQRFLLVDEQARTLSSERPMELDFSSLAKGYAVDRVAEFLAARGVEDYMVEVGGEIRAAGQSPRGDLWRIAIETPDGRAGVAAALELEDAAVATSGDYRNFFERDGKRYSHTLDPRTGAPVEHGLVSVTVLHEQAMLADAWATALSVLGPDAGMAVAKEQGLAVYFISRQGERLEPAYTEGFTRALKQGLGSASSEGDSL